VLVFEDLHWADDNLLDFVDYLVDWATDSPLLVLGTARPELLERRPDWGGGKSNAATTSLSPLSEEDTARLISSLLEETVMPAEKQALLLSRAGGNPLYAEEYARMVAERGIALTDEAPLPETVQGIVAARLDALSAEEKTLIQDAAVIGKVFWSGPLAAMSGLQRWTVEEQLHALERKEFVRRDRRSSVATETEYAFRHVLVRDVAYGQVPRSARAEKHRRAAEWIETLGADREDRAEMLAHHYASALEFARASGQPVDAIADRARVALFEAGERAYGLYAYASAAGFYRDAVELWPPGEPGGGRLRFRYARSVDLSDSAVDALPLLEEARNLLLAEDEREVAAEAEIALGQYHWFRADRASATPREEQAAVLIEGVEPSRAKAFVLSELSRFAMLRDDDARAVDLAKRALAMAEEFGADEVRARALNILGVSTVKLGDRRGLADVERSIEIAAEIGSPEVLRGYINLASTLAELGELERSSELHVKGLKEAERIGAPEPLRWLRAERIWDDYMQGRWNEAEGQADAFLSNAGAGHSRYMATAALLIRALIRLGRGDSAAALEDSDTVLGVARAAADPQVVIPSLAFHSHILLATDHQADAGALLDELIVRRRALPSGLVSHWVIPFVVVLKALGRVQQLEEIALNATMSTRWLEAGLAYASDEFSEAADTLGEIGSRPDEAFVRLRAAEALVEAGRRAEANVQLERALAFYRSVGATAYVREAEALFAASA
jgi:tetratricopeptide (TPR) repeat protein